MKIRVVVSFPEVLFFVFVKPEMNILNKSAVTLKIIIIEKPFSTI